MGTSVFRPETRSSSKPAIDDRTAYFMVTEAVAKARNGLAYGRLHDRKTGLSCAIGTMWDANPKVTLHTSVVDEVAAVNDMFNGAETPKQRQRRVLKWLRWKLRVLAGVPAFNEV